MDHEATTRVTPDEARAALRRVERFDAWTEDRTGRDEDRRLLEEAAAEAVRATKELARWTDCPFCKGWVYRLEPWQHFGRCSGMSTLARLRAAELALRLARFASEGRKGLEDERPLLQPLPGDRWPTLFRRANNIADAPAQLFNRVNRLRYPDESSKWTTILSRGLLEWEQVSWPERHPCPLCAKVVPAGELVSHYAACMAPAFTVGAVTAEARLARLVGDTSRSLLILAKERGRFRNELLALHQTAEDFEGNMGFSDGCSYIKPCYEKPFHEGCQRAKDVLLEGSPALAAGDREEPWYFTQLRDETRWYEEELRALLACCGQYWGGMLDGERGKSIAPRSSEASWSAGRRRARRAVEGGCDLIVPRLAPSALWELAAFLGSHAAGRREALKAPGLEAKRKAALAAEYSAYRRVIAQLEWDIYVNRAKARHGGSSWQFVAADEGVDALGVSLLVRYLDHEQGRVERWAKGGRMPPAEAQARRGVVDHVSRFLHRTLGRTAEQLERGALTLPRDNVRLAAEVIKVDVAVLQDGEEGPLPEYELVGRFERVLRTMFLTPMRRSVAAPPSLKEGQP